MGRARPRDAAADPVPSARVARAVVAALRRRRRARDPRCAARRPVGRRAPAGRAPPLRSSGRTLHGRPAVGARRPAARARTSPSRRPARWSSGSRPAAETWSISMDCRPRAASRPRSAPGSRSERGRGARAGPRPGLGDRLPLEDRLEEAEPAQAPPAPARRARDGSRSIVARSLDELGMRSRTPSACTRCAGTAGPDGSGFVTAGASRSTARRCGAGGARRRRESSRCGSTGGRSPSTTTSRSRGRCTSTGSRSTRLFALVARARQHARHDRGGGDEGLKRVEFLGGGERYKVELADRFEPLGHGSALASGLRGRAFVGARSSARFGCVCV